MVHLSWLPKTVIDLENLLGFNNTENFFYVKARYTRFRR
jgi:hypothetical protein